MLCCHSFFEWHFISQLLLIRAKIKAENHQKRIEHLNKNKTKHNEILTRPDNLVTHVPLYFITIITLPVISCCSNFFKKKLTHLTFNVSHHPVQHMYWTVTALLAVISCFCEKVLYGFMLSSESCILVEWYHPASFHWMITPLMCLFGPGVNNLIPRLQIIVTGLLRGASQQHDITDHGVTVWIKGVERSKLEVGLLASNIHNRYIINDGGPIRPAE